MLATSRAEMSSASGQEEALQCGSQERASDRHFDVYFLDAIFWSQEIHCCKGSSYVPPLLDSTRRDSCCNYQRRSSKTKLVSRFQFRVYMATFQSSKRRLGREILGISGGKNNRKYNPWGVNPDFPHQSSSLQVCSQLYSPAACQHLFLSWQLAGPFEFRAWDHCVPTDLPQYWFVPELRILSDKIPHMSPEYWTYF